MAIKCYVLLCIALTSSFFITSDALPATHNLFHRLQKRSGLRLCGRMLVEALAAICQSQYYAPNQFKRNFAYNSEKDYPIWDPNYPEEVLEPQTDLDFFSMNQLSRRGIADECCTKSCTFDQLSSYCGPRLRK